MGPFSPLHKNKNISMKMEIRKIADKMIRLQTEIMKDPRTKNVVGFALVTVLAAIGFSLAQPAGQPAKLTSPASFPITMDGKQVGATTLPIGAAVTVLETANGKVRVKANVGEAWLPEADVLIEESGVASPAPVASAPPAVNTPSQPTLPIAAETQTDNSAASQSSSTEVTMRKATRDPNKIRVAFVYIGPASRTEESNGEKQEIVVAPDGVGLPAIMLATQKKADIPMEITADRWFSMDREKTTPPANVITRKPRPEDNYDLVILVTLNNGQEEEAEFLRWVGTPMLVATREPWKSQEINRLLPSMPSKGLQVSSERNGIRLFTVCLTGGDSTADWDPFTRYLRFNGEEMEKKERERQKIKKPTPRVKDFLNAFRGSIEAAWKNQ